MKLTALAWVLALALLSTLVHAGSISPPPPPPPPPPPAANPALCSAQQPQFCLNGTTSSATSLDALRVSLLTPRGCAGAGGLGQKSSECDMRSGSQKGAGLRAPIHVAAASGASALLAADQSSSVWGAWASYGKAKFEGRVPAVPYKADLDSVRVGGDYALSQRQVLGAALTVERLDTSTRFNGGGQDADVYMITPYYLFILNETFSFDVNAGLGNNRVKQRRIDPLSAPGAPTILRSSFDGTRYFASATVTGQRANLGNVLLGGRAGYLEARERQESYTESGGANALTVGKRTIKLGQVFAILDAGYVLTPALEVYGSGAIRHDVRRSDGGSGGGVPGSTTNRVPGDRTGYDLTLGLRFFGYRVLSGYVEIMKTLGREDFDHKALNLLIRMDL